MKILYVVRHAKSSWDNPALSDFSRPLNERGKNDAPQMGLRLKRRQILPDLIVSSPANRALTTAHRIAETIGYAKERILEDKLLYLAGVTSILSVVEKVDDHNSSLMIFGHNPGWTDFVNAVSDKSIDNLPTCGIVAIRFDMDSWKQIGQKKGNQIFFDYPKKEFSA